MSSNPNPPNAATAADFGLEDGLVRRSVTTFRHGQSGLDEDWIASEIPLALYYNDAPHVVMMVTPMDIEDFALGFSLSEAIIASNDEFKSVKVNKLLEGFEVRVQVPAARADAIAARQRNLVGRSSCGLCGTRLLEEVVRHPPSVGVGPRIENAALHRALAALDAAQPLNRRTGATHAAAWADGEGNLELVREDVGRHNALDKLIGAMTRQGINVDNGFLILTSRASYEMVQKAATLGITLIAAISAPTALAIHLAESTGVTLIGFARRDSHVVYTHAQRVVESES